MEASLGELEVRVEGTDLDEVQEKFEETWVKRLEEAESSVEAMRKLARGYL